MAAVDAAQKISATAPFAWAQRGTIAYSRGDLNEAIRCFERAASRRRTPFALSHLGYAHAKSGRKDDALKVIAELDQASPGKPDHDYEIGMVHVGLGDKEKAFAALDRAIANQATELLWINVDYRTGDLRIDPRFALILERLGIRAAQTH